MSDTAPSPRFDPKRIYSALVFIPFFYVLTRHLPPIFFFWLILLVSFLAQWEFYGLAFREHFRPELAGAGLISGGIILVSLQWPDALSVQVAVVFILIGMMTYQVGRLPTSPHSWGLIPLLLFGVMYISLTLGHFLLIRKLVDGPLLIFFVLLVVWGGDAAAYYVGKTWGSRPLAPLLSPKKTLEGLIGGLLASMLIAEGASLWFLPIMTWKDCLILGILLTLLGLIGDLSESVFKRQAGAKDSGHLIPGHGGFLDRIDSLLFTVPTFYYYMVVIKNTQPVS